MWSPRAVKPFNQTNQTSLKRIQPVFTERIFGQWMVLSWLTLGLLFWLWHPWKLVIWHPVNNLHFREKPKYVSTNEQGHEAHTRTIEQQKISCNGQKLNEIPIFGIQRSVTDHSWPQRDADYALRIGIPLNLLQKASNWKIQYFQGYLQQLQTSLSGPRHLETMWTSLTNVNLNECLSSSKFLAKRKSRAKG